MESIRRLIAIFILFRCIGIFAYDTTAEKVKPSILYIFTDDQSFRTVSAYPKSHEWVNTLYIDKLAEEGMRFSNCYLGIWCIVYGVPYHRSDRLASTRNKFFKNVWFVSAK